ncbi:NUDIX hydrolase [Spartinivicinus ruber]|uniref:NUDIX hydrolase n=1 Tax=Spartinivicinus ruber TaxID=2683272 RepID=UPI0013D5C48B|nr:NUDIX hydrolase [Spartinivicinus ruber]
MATWAVIENEKKILLIRRSLKTSRSGQWCFPGGGIKENESPEEACIREVKEETSLDIKACHLVAKINGNNYFRCQLSDQNQKICLKLDECDEFLWVSPSKILEVGTIMDLKNVYRILSSMSYMIELNDEARQIIGLKN